MKNKLKILHLEDNPGDAALVAASLEEGGIDCELVRVDTREEFVTVLEQCSFDLIFADRTTPSFDGLSALQIAREICPATPFIFVSGTLDEELAIKTLGHGATDYVLKDRISRLLPAVQRAVSELQRKRELYHAGLVLQEQAELLDRANDMIMIRDLADRILYWNEGAEKLLGLAKSEALGKKPAELFDATFPRPLTDIHAELLHADHWQGEVAYTTKDGRRVLVSSHWTLRRDNNGNPSAIMEINSDLTARRLLEAQLLQAQKLESLGSLAGGIAHDFNNILGIVLGYGSLLETLEGISDEVRDIGATIVQAGERGAGLVRQLLTFARKDKAVLAPTNINAVVENLAKMLTQTFPKNISLRRHLTKDVKPIIADETQLHQILLNLCVNARDAMPGGGTLTIETAIAGLKDVIARFPKAAAPEYVRLSVTDSGTGMSAETKARLFEPFYTTKEVGKGTGLGLAVVYGAVESHNGFIDVTSSIGAGTSFSLFFPITEEAEATSNAGTNTVQLAGNNALVVLVEDEPMLRELLATVLKKHDFRVITARDGIEGLAAYEENKREVAALISDLAMPKLGGLEMLGRIRQSGSLPKTILLTGNIEPDLQQRLRENGVADFVFKPCRPAELLKALSKLLQKHSSRP
jgi:PAS domain S-box-containing protein